MRSACGTAWSTRRCRPRCSRGKPVRGSLAPIVAAYPALKGNLWTGVAGNHEVGEFVPAEMVPALRAFVEAEAERLPASKQPGANHARSF